MAKVKLTVTCEYEFEDLDSIEIRARHTEYFQDAPVGAFMVGTPKIEKKK